MTPQVRHHPKLEQEQAHVRRAKRRLDAELQAALGVDPKGGDKKADAALIDTARAKAERLSDVPDKDVCIGCAELASGKRLHVGKVLITGEDTPVLVYSWSSKVGPMFFEATKKDPRGLERKLKFELDGLIIRGIEDEYFGADADGLTEVTDDGEIVVVEEELPLEGKIDLPEIEATDSVIADLARGREPQMRDIVATITQDQYRLIRDRREGVLVVQGGPGTGKTAVALHRAAWLLANHRDELGRAPVLVVGPNRAFMTYIAKVLPMLGEHAVDQADVDHLTASRVKALPELPEIRRLKGDIRMATVVGRAVESLIRPLDEAVSFQLAQRQIRVSAEDARAALANAQRRSTNYESGRSIFRAEMEGLAVASATKTANFMTRGRVEDEVRAGLTRSNQWAAALERAWPTRSPQQVVHTLFTTKRRLDEAADGVLSSEEIEMLRRPRDLNVGEAPWTTDDLALIDEADHLLGSTADTYGYVIVDEAQDLTPMQMRMVARRSRGDMTLVGDLAQATGPHRPRDWSEVTKTLGEDAVVRTGELRLSYRVPMQAMELAAPVQRAYAPGVLVPQAVRRGDSDVTVRASTGGELADDVATEILALRRERRDERSIGVITPEPLRKAIQAALEDVGVEAGQIELDGIAKPVTVLPPGAAKGLEFDHVVLVEPAMILGEDDRALPLLFVALTRATQRLAIVHAEPLPAVLRGESPPAPETVAVPPTTPVPPAAPVLGGQFTEALIWAKFLYDGRSRLGKPVPYFGHLMGTSALVLDDGGSEAEAIAALLHDAPEDHDRDQILREIGQRFGAGVAALVAACTDPAPEPGETWGDVKVRHIIELETAAPEVRRIVLAEKLDNLRTLLRDRDRVGDAVYARMGADVESMTWYLTELATLFSREQPGAMSSEFERAVLTYKTEGAA